MSLQNAFVPREIAVINRHLSRLAREARASREPFITFDVGQVCRDLDLVSSARFGWCCSVLDSDSFAARHGLKYHHRTGVWGTGDARYTFIVGERTFVLRRTSGGLVHALIWMLTITAAAGILWAIIGLAVG